ncbi:MAG: phosphomannomutase/phosphoglucomutase [Chloroflexi bacterium]|nr:phosphomannomutase/phosphoglucomutase [Chloroflexota bacterium]
MNTAIPENIFRSNDIRGLVEVDLTNNIYYLLGKGYGTFIQQQGQDEIYVGFDTRPSSSDFAQAFIQGLVSTGCRVYNLGMVPVPVLYYSVTRTIKGFGAMVTASHLPAKYNGLKICYGSTSLSKGDILKIRDIIQNNDFLSKLGFIEDKINIADDYIDYIIKSLRIESKVKVVIDCQNGAASLIAPRIMEKIASVVDTVHCNISTNYPFDRPDPQVAGNLVNLQEHVVRSNADIGIAYDGDGDRFVVVDHKGKYISPDYILALFARDVLTSLQEKSEGKIVFDVLSSMTLFDEVQKNNGIPLWCKSGHSYIKQMMVKENALLGGESSGHMCFADRYLGYDDGIYASCRLVELISKIQTSLQLLIESLPRYITTPESRPFCPDNLKFNVIEKFKERLYSTEYTFTTLDGVEIYFPEGRGVVRAANTEPALSIRFEADNSVALNTHSTVIWRIIDESAKSLGFTLYY